VAATARTNTSPRAQLGEWTSSARDRIALLSLLGFLGVTAMAGGIGILFDWLGLPLDWLDGSVFSSYTIPGIALIGVGVAAFGAALLTLRHHPLDVVATVLAGLSIGIYETVEVFVVPFHWLQVFYMTVGLLIILLAGQVHGEQHET
jgi:hypothetical protein